ncbi:MAG: glycine--tRNA ligase subunit beta [Candidatus Cloacimonetes bacterium]|nr:glycine--tRNA ligase subunit beta [Candidatus Cloacimonadota bacterium]
MKSDDFLFEVGIEEIPAGYISNAAAKLQEGFRSYLQENKLEFEDFVKFSTPRRLAILITGLQTRQQDEVVEKVGPLKSLSYTADNQLTRAAAGFLQNAGGCREDIYLVPSSRGEKIAVKVKKKGREATEILQEGILNILKSLPFPKTMHWGDTKFLFARPIRWLLILFGDKVIDVELDGIRSGNYSFGNRFFDRGEKIFINYAASYRENLLSARVLASRGERKDIIIQQLQNLYQGESRNVIINDNLLEEVTDLVEYPTAVNARFKEKFLELPDLIVTSTLSQHQKYFAVTDGEGKLTNDFVFISNGDPSFSDLIRTGNERVVEARLEDAEFYYREDLKTPLADFVDKLKDVTFQENLGTLHDKMKRISKIALKIGNEIGISASEKEKIKRAAYLCKADLVTLMLGEKEFTKLQGYIGMQYARASAEDEEVALAIYEHYLPRGVDDELPRTVTGAVIAIADRIDTICGICGSDMLPTGSNDPFALRRAANGIVLIIAHHALNINLLHLIDSAYEILADKLVTPYNNKDFVINFLKQRVNWLLKEKGIDYDVIESVMHIDYSDLVDLLRRARDLQDFKQRDDFNRLVIGFKRVSNIIAAEKEFSLPDISLFQEPAEFDLYHGYEKLGGEVDKLLKSKNYHKIMELLVGFGPVIDKFFDDVLVNVENEKLRKNRYFLLAQIRSLFRKTADIAKIVLAGKNS